MWLFELLLRLYPAGFRSEYGESMRMSAREELAEGGVLTLVPKLLWDFAMAWPVILGEEILQDVRHALRNWARRPITTGTAVMSLAIAIGASTGVFSVVNAMLLRSLPFARAEELVQLNNHYAPVYQGKSGVADWQRKSQYLSDSVSFKLAHFQVGTGSSPLHVKGAETTANFFRVLGTSIAKGRGFLTDEDQQGKSDVVVLSHSLFEQGFGGDPTIVGKTVEVQHRKLTVVGIAPPGFDYPMGVGFWTPKIFDPDSLAKSGVSFQCTVGRLRSGMTLPGAQSAFEAESRHTLYGKSKDPEMRPRLVALREAIGGPILKSSLLLMLAVLAMVVIACANLAGLLLSRFAERQKEFQTRLFLGANRSRIRQQILTECQMLGLLAGGLGIGFAMVTTRWLEQYLSPGVAFQSFGLLDWRVVLFGVVMTLGCGLLCGGIAAFSQGTEKRKPKKVWRQVLVVAQVSLAVVLLGASTLMTEALLKLQDADIGFEARGVQTASVSLAGSLIQASEREADYIEASLERARKLPGAEAVAAADFVPLGTQGFAGGSYKAPGRSTPVLALNVRVSPGFFATMKTPLLKGREFDRQDRMGTASVVVVNEAMARLHGGESAIVGRKLAPVSAEVERPVVVGVVKSLQLSQQGEPAPPVVYSPLAQSRARAFTLLVRGRVQAAEISATLDSIDRSIPIYDVKSLQSRLKDNLKKPTYLTATLVFFCSFAVGITLLHLFGVCILELEQRRKELSIRLAVGATHSKLRQVVARAVLLPVLLGLAVGAGLRGLTRELLLRTMDMHFLKAGQMDIAAAGLMALVVVVTLVVATSRIGRLNLAEGLKAD